MEKEKWYILQTWKEQEYEAEALLDFAVSKSLYSCCRILRKFKMFRVGGAFRMVEDMMFPGYLFIRTAYPKQLQKELKKSREFPQFFSFGKNEVGQDELIPISEKDLGFLQNVCGTQLQFPMGVTDIILGENRQILKASGALENYVNQIVRLNLHKRFAVAEIPLFNRNQTVLFGIRLEQDFSLLAERSTNTA